MILREFDPAAGDADRLHRFRCSTGQPFEDEVEAWIGTDAVMWTSDVPPARFQRRVLAFVEDDDSATVAVVAWQDITRHGRRGAPGR